MQNLKIFPGTIVQTPVLGERKAVLFLRKCTKTLLQQCRIPKISRSPGPPFLGKGWEVASSWNYVWLRHCLLENQVKNIRMPRTSYVKKKFRINFHIKLSLGPQMPVLTDDLSIPRHHAAGMKNENLQQRRRIQTRLSCMGVAYAVNHSQRMKK